MIEWIEPREPLATWDGARDVQRPEGLTAVCVDEALTVDADRDIYVNGRTGGWVVASGAERALIKRLRDMPTRHSEADEQGTLDVLWDRGLLTVNGCDVLEGVDVNDAIETTRQRYTLVLLLSTGCNLACSYCYLGHRLPTADVRMPDETALAAVRLAIEKPWDEVMVDFGEIAVGAGRHMALARAAMKIAADAGKRVRIAVQTNGTTIDRDAAEELAAIDAIVGVSIDGPRDVHDGARTFRGGRRSYDRVTRGISHLREAQVDFHLIATIGRHNIGVPQSVVDELVSHQPGSFLLKPVLTEGEARDAWDQNGVTSNEFASFATAILDGVVDWDAPQRLDQTATKFVRRFIGDRNGWRDSCTSRSCGSGRSLHVVDPNGRSHACPRFVDGGVASRVPVELSSKNGKGPANSVPDLSDLLDPNLRQPPKTCEGCAWLASCGGGCTLAGHEGATPSIPLPDPHCTSYDASHRVIASRLIPAFLDGRLAKATAFNGAVVHRVGIGEPA